MFDNCCPEKTFDDKEDRKGALFGTDQSICPKCRKTVQAKVIFRDGNVILTKRCKDHGEIEAILSSDIE